MRKHIILHLIPGASPDEVIDHLESFPIVDLYTLEDPENQTTLIGGWTEQTTFPHNPPLVQRIDVTEENQIDWQEQWETFAPDFRQGLAHIDLSLFGCPTPLLLKPGGGFGDFSHPSTRLCLELMAPLLPQIQVIDVGCGSGVLMLAALMMGATNAIGIDIDEIALAHTAENALCNHLFDKILLTKEFSTSASQENSLILMNMILSEQQTAWHAQTNLHSLNATIITSGILTSQREAYLALTTSWKWQLIDERSEGEWAGFVFIQKTFFSN